MVAKVRNFSIFDDDENHIEESALLFLPVQCGLFLYFIVAISLLFFP
jgi:hypothetical protein